MRDIQNDVDEPEFLAELKDALDEYSRLTCEKCGGTGYRRNWSGMRIQCEDCWNDMGDDE